MWFLVLRSIGALGYIARRFIFVRSFTPRRFANYLLVTFQKKVTKNSRMIGYPYEVIIDSTSICNLHCPLCPTGQGRDERPLGKMPLQQFQQLIDEIGPYVYEIDLYNWGEPFINHDVYEMIAYAHQRRIHTNINSNFTLMDELRAERIVRSGLDRLSVSLDGASQATYEKYRVGGKFDKVIQNLRLLIEAKKRLKSKTPKMVWQFIVMKHNEHEIERARQYAKELGVDDFKLCQVRSDMGREIFQSDAEKLLSIENWLPENEAYSRYDYTKKQRKVRHQTCWYPYTMAVVNWNGSISPCCAVWEEQYDFGNTFTSSFKDVWNGPMYQASRRVVSGKALEEDSTLDLICARCKLNGFVDH